MKTKENKKRMMNYLSNLNKIITKAKSNSSIRLKRKYVAQIAKNQFHNILSKNVLIFKKHENNSKN